MNGETRPPQGGRQRPSLDGIDEQAVIVALLRLEEIAAEVGWPAVMEIVTQLNERRAHAHTQAVLAIGALAGRNGEDPDR